MRQIKLGIVVAKPETKIVSEVEKYISSDWADMLLFPEGYLTRTPKFRHSVNLF